MDVKALEQLLQAVREGNLSVEEALQQLRALPYEKSGVCPYRHPPGSAHRFS